VYYELEKRKRKAHFTVASLHKKGGKGENPGVVSLSYLVCVVFVKREGYGLGFEF
jgi:hypothetical protein